MVQFRNCIFLGAFYSHTWLIVRFGLILLFQALPSFSCSLRFYRIRCSLHLSGFSVRVVYSVSFEYIRVIACEVGFFFPLFENKLQLKRKPDSWACGVVLFYKNVGLYSSFVTCGYLFTFYLSIWIILNKKNKLLPFETPYGLLRDFN